MYIHSEQGPRDITPAQLTHGTQPPHGLIIEPSSCQLTPAQAIESQQPLSPRKPSPTSHPAEIDTTPKHQRVFPNSNFNWSPDVVLLRNQRTERTPCDIITGAPLLTSKWKQQQHSWRGEGKKAPLLTMRERERHRGGTLQMDCAGSSQLPAPNGYRLVGSGSGTDSAYSRHSHKPIPQSSHAPILPFSHSLTLPGQKACLESRQNRWKKM